MSVRTGNGPSRRHCRSRSRAYYSPRETAGSDRVDRRRSRTWMGHRRRCPRIVVALVPVENDFSKKGLPLRRRVTYFLVSLVLEIFVWLLLLLLLLLPRLGLPLRSRGSHHHVRVHLLHLFQI